MESVVFDVGSGRGDFAAQLRERYGCRIWMLETCERRYSHCVARFASDPAVVCQALGLIYGGEDKKRQVGDHDCSKSRATSQARSRPFAAAFVESGVRQIDLLKVSSQFDVPAILEELIDSGLIHSVVHMQVQFSDYSRGDRDRRNRLRLLLSRTHIEQWCYPFIWESWRRRRADDRPMLHTIGDSHGGGVIGLVGAFDQIDGVMHHHLGPKLMHSVGRDGLDLRSYGIIDGDTVICCFGEIDCRCHVHKFGPNYVQTIRSTAERYIQALLHNLIRMPRLRLCVYNIVPPIRKAGRAENPDYPYLGTDEDRLAYVRCMNSILAEQCRLNGLCFVDISGDYADAAGYLRPDLSDATVHIVEPGPLRRFIETNLR